MATVNHEITTPESTDPTVPSSEPTIATDAKSEAHQATSHKRDIEHAEVVDDPRKWSRTRKVGLFLSRRRPPELTHSGCAQTFVLAIVSVAAMIAGLGGNIYNRKQWISGQQSLPSNPATSTNSPSRLQLVYLRSSQNYMLRVPKSV